MNKHYFKTIRPGTRKRSGRFVLSRALPLGVFFFVAAIGSATAADRVELTSDNRVARGLSLSEADQNNPVQKLDFEDYFQTDNWGRYKSVRSPTQGHELALQLIAQDYFSRSDLSNYTIMPRFEYWQYVTDKTRLRARGDFAHRVRDGERYFKRLRGQLQLRHRPGDDRQLFATAEVSRTDYNEAVLRGFDQMRYRLEGEHRWPIDGYRSFLSAGFSSEWTDADVARFSSVRYGPSVRLEKWVRDNLRVRLDAEYRVQRFDDAFSAAEPRKRKDKRTDLSFEIYREMSWDGGFFGGAGWIDNQSNISIRDTDGFTALFGVKFRYRTDH